MHKTGSPFFLPWLAALCLTAFAAPAQAAITLEAKSAANTMAVLYDEKDEPSPGMFSRFISGIEDTPGVVVYRVALNAADRELLAEATPRISRPVHLAYNDQASIAVIYPDIGEPYRSVFSRIIEGIEDKARMRVAGYAIGANQNAQDMAAELRRQNIRIVIALGRNGMKAAANLDRDLSVVVGGVLSIPESEARGMPVFSLAPDPNLLFERLKVLMPAVRRIFVVYDPRQNTWLIRLAREAAKKLNIELVAQEAGDLKSALRLYQDNLATVDPNRDAIWLPQDSVTVDESAVLPLVLQESWNRALVVFSSSVAHVKRGALFALYPNNVELGRNLASTALERNPAGTRAILPLKEVLMAVNIRTAGHLGLSIGQRQAFDLVYPEQ